MRMYTLASRLLLATSVLAFLPCAATAQGTASAPAAAEERASDIIVTANKRQERIQDVALGITALSGDELNERQLLDIEDLATRVPGLSFSRGAGAGIASQRLIIRGLNTGTAGGATVASAVDDAPLSFSSSTVAGGDFATDFEPFDMERIEVLKGPQGTLYGAASLGGIVKYVTKTPDPTRFSGGFDVGFANVLHGDTGASGKAYVNVPLGTTAAIRASGYYEYAAPWIGNQLGNQPANGFRRFGGRVSLLVKPSESFSIRATAFLQELQANGPDIAEVFGQLTPAKQFDLLKGYNFDTYLPQPYSTRSQLYTLNARYDFGGAELQSITSYGKLTTQFDFDTPLYYPFSALFFGRANTALVSSSLSTLEKWNQEFRLASTNNAARAGHGLEWQIGGFYTDETGRFVNNYITKSATGQPVITPASVAATPPGTSQVFLGDLHSKYREFAAYADATYHFSPAFDVELGGRVFNNKQSFYQTTGGALFSPAAFTTSPTTSSSETRATFAIAPRFHITPDAMIYARVASGYRPGGPNLTVPPPAAGEVANPGSASFGADTTVNYEVGVKASIARIFSLDVSAFYIDWTDIQTSVTVARGATGYPVTVNSGKAVSKGVEANFQLTPMRGLRFGLLGAYTDAKLSQNVPNINGFKDDALPYTPKWTATATADYEFPLADTLKAFVGGSYSYTGERFSSFAFRAALSHLRIPSYGTYELHGGVRGGNFGLQVYGKNLGDVRGITSYSGGQVVFGYFIPGTVGLIRPREIGVRLTGNF